LILPERFFNGFVTMFPPQTGKHRLAFRRAGQMRGQVALNGPPFSIRE
jgi:hypothetical protein